MSDRINNKKPKSFYVKKPCKDCPFRKDSMKGWLGKDRVTEFLDTDSFICHKTTGGELTDRRQCAGHMLMKGQSNGFVRIANQLGERLNLTGGDLVFDSEQDCIDHHSWEAEGRPVICAELLNTEVIKTYLVDAQNKPARIMQNRDRNYLSGKAQRLFADDLSSNKLVTGEL